MTARKAYRADEIQGGVGSRTLSEAAPKAPKQVTGRTDRRALLRHWQAAAFHARCCVARLCEEQNVQERWLERFFRDHFGGCPTKVLRGWQLAAASRLLAKGLPEKEVAYQLGFFDESHLSRTFKARYGLSPRGWLRQRRRADAGPGGG